MRTIAFVSVLLWVFLGNAALLNAKEGTDTWQERKRRNMINIGMTNFMTAIDPVSAWHYQEFLVIQSVYETLVRVSKQGDIVSGLAKSWNVDASGTHYRFQLRRDARFHNGEKVTGQDVAFSFARHLWPGSPSVVKSRLSSILNGGGEVKKGDIPAGIRVASENVIQFELKAPYPPFLSVLTMPAFSIVPRRAGSSSKPIGSGPLAASYNSAKNMWRLRKFVEKKGAKTMLSELNIFPVHGFTEAISALETGALDLVLGMDLQTMASGTFPAGLRVTKTNSMAFAHFFFNNNRTLFADPELRKDLGLALTALAKLHPEKNGILVYEPHLIPLGIMPPQYYHRPAPDVSLKEMERKWSGKINGRALKFVLRREFFDDDFAKHLRQTLEAFGFSSQIVFVGGPDYPGILKSNDYDVLAGVYMGNFADPDGFLEPINRNHAYQYGNIPSEHLFRELEKVRHLQDGRKRLAEYSRLLKQFEAEWYFVPLYRANLPFVHNDKIRIPDTHYRYECELWNILWRQEGDRG